MLPSFDKHGEEITIKGQLSRIRFTNDDGSFAVCELTSPRYPLPVTIVGNILSTQPGETLEVVGTFVDDARFGRQFKIARLKAVLPSSREGIERYLGGGLIDGIGPVLAERIVGEFGEQTLEILDEEPDRLFEVEGIGKKRAAQIAKAWVEQRAIRDVMIFLQMHRISTTFAVKIFRLYGESAARIVKDNPYQLAEDIYGIGFRKADAIALAGGIERDALNRLRAGVLFALREARGEGHMFLPMDLLLAKASGLLEIEQVEGLGDALESLRHEDKLVVEPMPGEESSAVWRKRAWHAEVDAAAHLKRLMQTTSLLGDVMPDEAMLAKIEAKLELELAALQRKAVLAVWKSRVVVITGGPGTGKTTIVRAVVAMAQAQGASVKLAAPTGRAAKRMSEATGEAASTLHRLLEYSFKEGFQVNQSDPLDADLLIIDEASMMDTSLMSAVGRGMPDGARLLLVGDIDQLPSVGPGNVLKDIIASQEVGVVRLTQIFRQASDSHIVHNAHRINQGQMPIVPDHSGGKLVDFYAINAVEAIEAQQKIVQVVTTRIPRAFGFDAMRDVQVLAPMHRGDVGCAQLNVLLQEALNPDGEELVRGQRRWRVGDKVMQQRNNYDQGVYNGDIGHILEFDHEAQVATVDFGDGRMATYEFGEMDELVLAYAITVHKSQGSEYKVVVMPVVTQHYIMLQRNLLYTAVTRARELVIVVGTQRAMSIAVDNDTAQHRYTRLRERLRGEL